jgi:MOSC domain-containing protein YiiM
MRLLSVNVGKVQPLLAGGRTVASAIGKRAVAGPVNVHELGLEGDEQADPSVHGGPSKAVYAYPQEHAAFWRTVRAQAQVSLWDDDLPPGFAGENLSLTGLLENQVWVGDRLRFAGCVLVVSEPRLPCFKFNAAMGFAHAVKMMAQSGYCGFYLAVLQPGRIAAGEAFELQPGPRHLAIPELFRARMAKSG